jgi:hypothetical protein
MPNESTIRDFILQSILIIGLGMAMIRSGQIVGTRFSVFDIPYAGQLGFVLGAIFIISIFVVLRQTYRTHWNEELGA